ncbi:sigma-70 family RNA polymerase sigma factor [Singulisphaera sp. Ch08]|uniref:Sigma-70 family RNA polymerase sigma factor n=1 Tax=Singulisphaera sp. Ch08 TaxID=3120278 RepID=A0AAU7C9R8_9BACT
MSALSVTTCGPSPVWRTFGRSPGPSIAAEAFDRARAHSDPLADTIRARRLLGTELSYIGHPSFDDPGAQDAILAPMPAPTAAQTTRRSKPPVGMPPYLASLYDEAPLLTREQEAHLFRKMNYLKFRASRLRAQIDPEHAQTEDLDEIERDQAEALALRGQLVRANLRLVVSIARRNLGSQDDLFERVSDGNLVLFRAVETFDYARGNKFSTYATWAIRNQLARASHAKSDRQAHFLLGQDDILALASDSRTEAPEHSDVQEQRQLTVARLLARLGDRERRVLIGRYGIGGACEQTLTQLGQELGVTKERVRQIEARAQEKLRGLARDHEIVALLA